MNVRCKFNVQKITRYSLTQEEVTLTAVMGGTEENQSFAKYTPSGTLTFLVDNPNVVGKFVPGTEYYIDLTPAASKQSAA